MRISPRVVVGMLAFVLLAALSLFAGCLMAPLPRAHAQVTNPFPALTGPLQIKRGLESSLTTLYDGQLCITFPTIGSAYTKLWVGTASGTPELVALISTSSSPTTGNAWFLGTGTPGSGTGADGDWYMDQASGLIWGPKASGAWPGTANGGIATPTTIGLLKGTAGGIVAAVAGTDYLSPSLTLSGDLSGTLPAVTVVGVRGVPVTATTPTQNQSLWFSGLGSDYETVGQSLLPSAKAVATANVASLSGTTTVDGVALADGDEVLLTGQSTAAQNGPWIVHAGGWSRPNFYPTGAAVPDGDLLWVDGGSTQSASWWYLSGTTPVTVDSTSATWARFGVPGGSSVTSVGLTLPGVLYTVSGSPITSSGTFAFSLINQSANAVLAGPTSGGSTAPTFRSLVSADIPALSYVTSVGLTVPSWLSVSGSPITSSGTLAVTANSQSAGTFLAAPAGSSGAPSFRAPVATDLAASPGAGKVLSYTGSALAWSTVSAAPGGSNTQIQYNNSGAFAGMSTTTTDGTNLLSTAYVRAQGGLGALLNPGGGGTNPPAGAYIGEINGGALGLADGSGNVVGINLAPSGDLIFLIGTATGSFNNRMGLTPAGALSTFASVTAPVINATTKFQHNGTDGVTTTIAGVSVDGGIITSGTGYGTVTAAGVTSVGLNTRFWFMDATAGNQTLDLPTAVVYPGQSFIVKKMDATANTVTIQSSIGGQTIDGAATYVLSSQYQHVQVVSDGTNWFIY